MIKLIRYDEKPITLIGECVGNCYGSDTTDPVKNYKRGKQCIMDGHGRVLEYPSVIMEIDDYSIKVVREFYTHIVGVTRTQESTRYVKMKERGYFYPPKIEKSPEAL
jgi:thymidylate synthase (FAD)